MEGWVAVLGAVGTLAVTVGGVLGVWWLRIMSRRHQLRLDELAAARAARREEGAEERKSRKDTIKELYDILEVQRADREQDRAHIHQLRGDLQAVHVELAVCKAERAEQARQIAALTEVLTEARLIRPGVLPRHPPAEGESSE
jgi:hypothetical protein